MSGVLENRLLRHGVELMSPDPADPRSRTGPHSDARGRILNRDASGVPASDLDTPSEPSSPPHRPDRSVALRATVSSRPFRTRIPRYAAATQGVPDMPGKQAKVVMPQMLRRMLRRTSSAPFPARDRVMILLSVKAGLRACEMAHSNGRWCSTLAARSQRSAIHDAIAKKRGGRRIPMHPDLRHALRSLFRISEPSGQSSAPPVAAVCARPAWSTGSRRCSESSASRDARRIPAAEPSSPPPRATSTAAAKPARRPTACRAPIDRDHRALHRWRHSRAEAASWPPVKRASLPPSHQNRKDSPCTLMNAGPFAVISPTRSGRAGSLDLRPPIGKCSLGSTTTRAYWALQELAPGTQSSRRRLAIETPMLPARWKASDPFRRPYPGFCP